MSLNILDLGCNFPAWALEKQLQEESINSYTGIEIAPASIQSESIFGYDYLKQEYPDAVTRYTRDDKSWSDLPDNFKIHFETDILDWLNKDTNKYDIVYMSNILHELPDNWQEVFDKAVKLLTPDGWVYISVYYNNSTHGEFYFTPSELIKMKGKLLTFKEEQKGNLRQFWAQLIKK